MIGDFPSASLKFFDLPDDFPRTYNASIRLWRSSEAQDSVMENTLHLLRTLRYGMETRQVVMRAA